MDSTRAAQIPVVLVPGFGDDDGASLERLFSRLLVEGRTVAILHCGDSYGKHGIEALALRLESYVEHLHQNAATEQIDLVGFSMGALISRYYIQRLRGKDRIRRFISISGPQHGTWTALGVPARLLGWKACLEMRPKSELLRDLNEDTDPWGNVEVHSVRSNFDHMIVPPKSSELTGVRSTKKFFVPVHRWIPSSPKVIEHVTSLLSA